MALGSIAGAVAGGIASAGASKLFGGGKDAPSVQPSQFLRPITTPLFSSSIANDGSMQVMQSPQLTAISQQRGAITGQIIKTLQEQRARVKPGFGELTRTRVEANENNRLRSVGNLRDNLARRRVAGSSFAGDAETRANLEFAQQEDAVRAESFLQELDTTIRMLTTEGELRLNNLEKWLSDLMIPTNAAVQLQAGAQAAMSQAAQTNAQLAAESQAGAGRFFGDAIDGIGSAVSDGVGKLFSGGGSGSGFSKLSPSISNLRLSF